MLTVVSLLISASSHSNNASAIVKNAAAQPYAIRLCGSFLLIFIPEQSIIKYVKLCSHSSLFGGRGGLHHRRTGFQQGVSDSVLGNGATK